MASELIAIGKIVTPHGVRGDVRVIALTDFPERFLKMEQVLLDQNRTLLIQTAKFHQRYILLKFKGYNDRNAVECLRNQLLYVKREEVMPLSKDQYYVFELIGMSVHTVDGQYLGVLEDIIQTGSNDVYVVERESQKPLLVPALKRIVNRVSVVEKRMEIQSPEEWDADED